MVALSGPFLLPPVVVVMVDGEVWLGTPEVDVMVSWPLSTETSEWSILPGS